MNKTVKIESQYETAEEYDGGLRPSEVVIDRWLERAEKLIDRFVVTPFLGRVAVKVGEELD